MYTIRFANTDDAETLAIIHSRSWNAAYKNIVPDEILEKMNPENGTENFKKALKEGWGENAILFKDHKATGLICIGKCRDKDKDDLFGEIWGMYLLPEYWNMGIGTELIAWGLKELKNRGYEKVTLWVLEENVNARKFYEKMGFKHDGTVKEITIGKKLNEYRYVKDIE